MSELSLFAAIGVELEYMIVDCKRFNVRPIADRLLVDRDGEPVSDLTFGGIAWSNELVNHVVEFKTNGPARSLAGLAGEFHKNIVAANRRLVAFGARLMPTAMHPWMNPAREKQLWIGDFNNVYELFDQIFDCSGHGWSNVQSTHLNLPFRGDDEFGRLHAAIRLILPILPAIAASSPIHDGRRAPMLDARLNFYQHNCDAVPSVAGGVIPEPVFTRQQYQQTIFEPMLRDIAPHDPEGILEEEFLNARGAIARFERGSIEIRLLDVQECPAADLAIAALVVGLAKEIVEEQFRPLQDQQSVCTDSLRAILSQSIAQGGDALIDNRDYLAHLGLASGSSPVTGKDLWARIADRVTARADSVPAELKPLVSEIVASGTLASRILAAIGDDYSPTHLKGVYAQLCDSLAANELFRAP